MSSIISKKELTSNIHKQSIENLRELINISLIETNSKGYTNIHLNTHNYNKTEVEELVKELISLGYHIYKDNTWDYLSIFWKND